MASRITQSPSPPDRSITSFDAEVETSSIYSEPEAEERLKKRSKTSAIEYNDSKAKKTRKTRGGKLRDLPGMPLDILFEIFGHLLPRDVLHLSRATKSLRNILMRRSAVSIWKNAFSNLRIKPPSRPSDMTEPQWTSFLFDSYCQVSPIPWISHHFFMSLSSSVSRPVSKRRCGFWRLGLVRVAYKSKTSMSTFSLHNFLCSPIYWICFLKVSWERSISQKHSINYTPP